MQNIGAYCKSSLITLVALIGISSFVPSHSNPAVVGTVVRMNPFYDTIRSFVHYLKTKDGMMFAAVTAAWIRLRTKPTYDYKLEDWKEDLATLLECWKLYDIETYKNFVALVDKWIIGRKFSLLEIEREFTEDGVIVTVKGDKKPKTTPFGLLGLFDAYIIQQFESLASIRSDFGTIEKGLGLLE